MPAASARTTAAAGEELEDPPVGPLPVTGSGLAGGTAEVANAGLRLIPAGLLARVRKRS